MEMMPLMHTLGFGQVQVLTKLHPFSLEEGALLPLYPWLQQQGSGGPCRWLPEHSLMLHTMCSFNPLLSLLPHHLLPPPAFIYLHAQVAYVSSAPFLSDRTRFPYLLRVHPSETSAHKAQGIIVGQFDYEKVTIITQNEDIFVSVS